MREEGRGECQEGELAEFKGLWFAQLRKVGCGEVVGVGTPGEEFEECEVLFVFNGCVIGAEALYLGKLEEFGENVCAWGRGCSRDDVGQKSR